MPDELKQRVNLMKRVAIKAGKAIVDPKLQAVKESKTGHQDILTLGDLKSEQIITEQIKRHFPDDKILSEEGSPQEQVKDFGGYVWVIDPIDGTINYARNRNNSAVSIGIVLHNRPIAGAIYNPYVNELFWAAQGEGAYLNDKQIHVSRVDSFKKALCLIDNGTEGKHTRQNLKTLLAIPDFERFACTGSAVLHYCEVASGRADFYLHAYLKPWDNAAGFILVEEAGGVIKGLKGENVDYFSPKVVAGNKKIIKEYFNTTK